MANDVPINPTGFAHGFRPLEGDHPPPTPTPSSHVNDNNNTHRGINNDHARQGDALFGGLSGASTVVVAEEEGGGGGSARKRRRLPGPLAFLQQGGSAGAGKSAPAQEARGSCEGGEASRKNNFGDEDGGEMGGGHFVKGPWLSLCSAIDAPIPEEGASNAQAVQAYLTGAVAPIAEVLVGEFDLRVPVITAVIDSLTKLSQSDVVVELVDPSGRMRGYLHPGCMEEHGPDLAPGAALLLKEVSIFVTGPGTIRLLNIHPSCVLGVFPADTPLPTPERLDWLRTCDPPFTPKVLSACERRSSRQSPRPASPPITPPQHPTTQSTPRLSGRRRPRPEAALGKAAQPSPPPPPRGGSHLLPVSARAVVFRVVGVSGGEERGRTTVESRSAGSVFGGSTGVGKNLDGLEHDGEHVNRGTAATASRGSGQPSSPSHRNAPFFGRDQSSPPTSQLSASQSSTSADRLPPSPSRSNSIRLTAGVSQTQIALGQGEIAEDRVSNDRAAGGGARTLEEATLEGRREMRKNTQGEVEDTNGSRKERAGDGGGIGDAIFSRHQRQMPEASGRIKRMPTINGGVGGQGSRDGVRSLLLAGAGATTSIGSCAGRDGSEVGTTTAPPGAGSEQRRDRMRQVPNTSLISSGLSRADQRGDRASGSNRNLAVGRELIAREGVGASSVAKQTSHENAGGETLATGGSTTDALVKPVASVSKSMWTDLEGLDSDDSESSSDGKRVVAVDRKSDLSTKKPPSVGAFGPKGALSAKAVAQNANPDSKASAAIGTALKRPCGSSNGYDKPEREGPDPLRPSEQAGVEHASEEAVPTSQPWANTAGDTTSGGVFSLFNVVGGVMPGSGDGGGNGGDGGGSAMMDDILDAALEDSD